MQPVLSLIRRRPLAAIVTLAIALRLAALLALPEVFAFERTGIIQGIGTHDVYAQNLLQTGVYGFRPGEPDGVLPPLYSLFLAAVYAVAGRGALQLVLAQALLDAASIALLYRIARRLWPGEPRVALIGALLHALYPYLLFQSLTMIDTSLYISGMYLLLCLLLQVSDASAKERRHLALLLAAGGATLCLLLLLRPNIVVLLPFAGLWLALRHGWRGSATRLLPVVLLGGVLLLPWIARSAGIYGQPVFIALHGGRNFWQGNNPCTLPYLRAGYDTQWQREDFAEGREVASLVQRDALAMQVSLNWLRENPARIPELLWTKFVTHWSVDIQPSRNPPVSAAGEAVDEDALRGRHHRHHDHRRRRPGAGLRRVGRGASVPAGPSLLVRRPAAAGPGRSGHHAATLARTLPALADAALHDPGLRDLPPGYALPRAHRPPALSLLGLRAAGDPARLADPASRRQFPLKPPAP